MAEAEKYNTHIPFEFRGDGKSYFRIWVVNLFLSLITLGVYSAWAKVRSNRYFYSHLYLDGSSFEYVANPLSILIGRVAAVILFVAYNLISQFLPELSIWFLGALIPVIPWMIFKSLQFRARNSIYRNIRFGFHGTYKKALLVMGIYPALMISPFILLGLLLTEEQAANPTYITLGILGAYVFSFSVLGFVLYQFYSYVVNNSSYGKTRFTFSSSVKEYYGLLTMMFFSMLGLMIIFGIAVGIAVALTGAFVPQEFGLMLATGFGAVFGMAAYVWMIAMYSVGTTNRLYNGILIPAWYTFQSAITTSGLFKVYFINTVLIVLTVGLYIPFAKIRLINYRVQNLKFVSTLNLDEFVFDSNEDVAAMGQEMGEMFDLGLSL